VILFNDFLSNELLSKETLSVLFLTLKFSLLALILSWFGSLVFVFFVRHLPFVFSVFKLLWVLPGFAYALVTLEILKCLNVTNRYSMMTVTLAWIFAGIPYLALSMQNAIQDLDFREKEVIQSLGAKPLRAFYFFEFLRTGPSQGAALLQQFWLYLTSFSLVMILSGGFPSETLEVAIFSSVRLDHVDFARALALGIWQMLLLIPLRIVLNRVQIRTGVSEWARDQKVKTKAKGFYFKILTASILLLFLIVPFVKGSSRLELAGMGGAIFTSLVLGTGVSIISLVWAIVFYGLKMSFIAEIGAWFSPMLLTLLWWRQFAFTLLPWANALFVQVILFSPWIARMLYPILGRIRRPELEAARSLGCSPLQAWVHVEWPRLKPTLFFGLSVVFALSCTEVASVLLFAQRDFEPLSVWVQNSFMRFRLDEAMLGTCILIAISFMALNLRGIFGGKHERT
jgi:ABC-type Fe3+ transport system permease subunit